MAQEPDVAHRSPSLLPDFDNPSQPNGYSEDRDSSPADHMNPSKPKDRDPSKPKRKKARRACAACQRAHLTCSDERPCERCIKRNLAEQCQDGARKKAKYLHDAPNDALVPGHANKYKQEHAGNLVSVEQPLPMQSYPAPPQPVPVPMPTDFKLQSPISSGFDSQQPSPQALNTTHPAYPQQQQQQQQQQYMEPGDPTLFNFDLNSMNFGNHYGAMEFGMLGSMGAGADASINPAQSPLTSSAYPYDSTQPFPDHRASADFSMASPNHSSWPPGQHKHMHVGHFEPLTANMDAWRRNSQSLPNAFAIGTGSTAFSGQSPASSIELYQPDFGPAASDVSASASHPTPPPRQIVPSTSNHRQSNAQQPRQPASPELQNQAVSRLAEPSEAISKKLVGSLRNHPAFAKRRQRDPSTIYKNVNKPYPYTLAFHALTAVVTRRFPAKKRVRIAKALASIRPSFISLNRNLVDPDLVFMEQNFQRSIWDYEEDSSACGTPTLIIRRTGEVAYADKEFTLLSGWTKDVLHGRAPNLNTNEAAVKDHKSGTATAASSRGGHNTPKNGPVDAPAGADERDLLPDGQPPAQQPAPQQHQQHRPRRQQPIFLAELLDDDSVVDFYEEYAQRAFGDSRGTKSRRCRILKYKPPFGAADDAPPADAPPKTNGHAVKSEGGGGGGAPDSPDDSKAVVSAVNNVHVNGAGAAQHARPGISSEEGMKRLGDEKGVVDCMYCWKVKQDCFNIPMLIVLNFLPIL